MKKKRDGRNEKMDGWDGWAIENERGEARNFTGAKAKAKVLLLTVWEVGRQFKKAKLKIISD